MDRRVDELTGQLTYVVGQRQERPNLPQTGCPFCVGGLEAPDPYEVRWFPNRWPALEAGRAEVVLYSPKHDATFWELGVEGVKSVIDLWAERTVALGSNDDVDYVLIFENRGPEVGATIQHPHGQIYAFDHVPALPHHELEHGDGPRCPNDDLLVCQTPKWQSWVPYASTHPYAIRMAPVDPVPDLPSLDASGRREMAEVLADGLKRLDLLFDARTPYMLWIHQQPTDGGDWPQARVHVDIISPWRSKGVMRFVAAGELGSGEYFNTVIPEVAAKELREVC